MLSALGALFLSEGGLLNDLLRPLLVLFTWLMVIDVGIVNGERGVSTWQICSIGEVGY